MTGMQTTWAMKTARPMGMGARFCALPRMADFAVGRDRMRVDGRLEHDEHEEEGAHHFDDKGVGDGDAGFASHWSQGRRSGQSRGGGRQEQRGAADRAEQLAGHVHHGPQRVAGADNREAEGDSAVDGLPDEWAVAYAKTVTAKASERELHVVMTPRVCVRARRRFNLPDGHTCRGAKLGSAMMVTEAESHSGAPRPLAD